MPSVVIGDKIFHPTYRCTACTLMVNYAPDIMCSECLRHNGLDPMHSPDRKPAQCIYRDCDYPTCHYNRCPRWRWAP